jgi:hypothetical protein
VGLAHELVTDKSDIQRFAGHGELPSSANGGLTRIESAILAR